MIEFTFRVTLKYRDPQAFLDTSLDRAHSLIAEDLRETIKADPYYFREVVIEVEPI